LDACNFQPVIALELRCMFFGDIYYKRISISEKYILATFITTKWRQMRVHLLTLSVKWVVLSLIEGCCEPGSYWTKDSSWLSWSYHFEVLRLPPWLGWQLWNICVTNDHGYVLFVINTSRSFPHSWLTRRVPLVEQEPSRAPNFTPRFLVRFVLLYL
jgi:hypothetical protein